MLFKEQSLCWVYKSIFSVYICVSYVCSVLSTSTEFGFVLVLLVVVFLCLVPQIFIAFLIAALAAFSDTLNTDHNISHVDFVSFKCGAACLKLVFLKQSTLIHLGVFARLFC